MTCQHCQFWTRHHAEVDDTRQPNGFGICTSTKFVAGYGMLWQNDRDGERPASPDECVVETDEGWGFYVGPEFGCVHFVQRIQP